MSRFLAIVLCAGALAAVCGCTSTSSSNTARTATEQMLVSNAVDQSLSKVDFQAFGNRKVFVEEKYLDCIDKNYVLSSVRHHVLLQNGQIVPKVEEADVILEVRSGAVGTNSSNSFLGIPQISIPGMVAIPEVKFVNRVNQVGMAKIGLVAYDAKSHEVLGDGGMSLAKSDENNWYFFGIGPWQNGTVKKEVQRGQPRYSNQPWIEVPSQVAFTAPLKAPPTDEDKVRLTSGKNEDKKTQK
ncbi:MAG: hypothetical protein IAG10_07280 [Planctomycetaceae bacterium]|nr:hypothetical protein [Planctomycetaceae bacterium]